MLPFKPEKVNNTAGVFSLFINKIVTIFNNLIDKRSQIHYNSNVQV